MYHSQVMILFLQKWGVAIFALYFAQAAFGAAVHWFKPRNSKRRPLQNYLHAIFGLLIIALALYQVRTGFLVEWPLKVGLGNIPNAVNIVWYVWVAVSRFPCIWFGRMTEMCYSLVASCSLSCGLVASATATQAGKCEELNQNIRLY